MNQIPNLSLSSNSKLLYDIDSNKIKKSKTVIFALHFFSFDSIDDFLQFSAEIKTTFDLKILIK